MITVANRIFVAQKYAEQFEQRFRDRAKLVDGMAGFVSNMVLRPTEKDDPYVVMTHWETREHFEAWVNSDQFIKGHARSGTLPKDAFTQANKLEIHEVFLTSDQK